MIYEVVLRGHGMLSMSRSTLDLELGLIRDQDITVCSTLFV
jgi:hypothetical protein